MLCDKFKEELIEAAASGAGLTRSLNKHVNLCAHCRGIFAAQQSLFALVDAGLHSRANVTVPGNFDHRVQVALQGEAAQDRKRYSAVWGFGSLAAAAGLLMALLLIQNVKHAEKETAENATVENKALSSPQAPVLSGRSLEPSLAKNAHSRERTSQRGMTEVRRQNEPEVLVPKGQEELLAKYMEGIAARKARVSFGADLQHEPNMKPVEVPSIEISELVIKPLSDLSSN